MHKRFATKKNFRRAFKKEVPMPKIPRQFLDAPLIAQVLASTINEFNFEEQTIIYLYCTVGLPIKEVVHMTELSESYVASTLVLFKERLSFKLNVFETTIEGAAPDKVSVRELFELRSVKEMQEREFIKHHIKWKAETDYIAL